MIHDLQPTKLAVKYLPLWYFASLAFVGRHLRLRFHFHHHRERRQLGQIRPGLVLQVKKLENEMMEAVS